MHTSSTKYHLIISVNLISFVNTTPTKTTQYKPSNNIHNLFEFREIAQNHTNQINVKQLMLYTLYQSNAFKIKYKWYLQVDPKLHVNTNYK